MVESFPERFRGMHHGTYMRFLWEHHEAEMKHLVGMCEWLDKLDKRVS